MFNKSDDNNCIQRIMENSIENHIENLQTNQIFSDTEHNPPTLIFPKQKYKLHV